MPSNTVFDCTDQRRGTPAAASISPWTAPPGWMRWSSPPTAETAIVFGENNNRIDFRGCRAALGENAAEEYLDYLGQCAGRDKNLGRLPDQIERAEGARPAIID